MITGSPSFPSVKEQDWCGEFAKAPNFNINEITQQKQRELDKKYQKFTKL
jgi:hypothetical protein